MFDHFVGLALKGAKQHHRNSIPLQTKCVDSFFHHVFTTVIRDNILSKVYTLYVLGRDHKSRFSIRLDVLQFLLESLRNEECRRELHFAKFAVIRMPSLEETPNFHSHVVVTA